MIRLFNRLDRWIILALLSSILLITGCVNGSDSDDNGSILAASDDYYTIPVNPANAMEQEMDSLIGDIRYMRLKLPEGMFYTQIQQIIVRDSLIVALDINTSSERSRIFTFDLDGTFRYLIDRPGQGPGEFGLVYDFSVTDESVILSTDSFQLLYFDRESGDYDKTVVLTSELRADSMEMPDNETLVVENGRFQFNNSRKQVKVYDLESGELVMEAVPFEDHSLKLGHTETDLYISDGELYARPMYNQTVYKLVNAGESYSLESVYSLDFDDYWVPEDFLAASYNDRERFFSEESREYVNTVHLFETTDVVYGEYIYGVDSKTGQSERYYFIYDKQAEINRDISSFIGNSYGWLNTPLTVNENWIVNTVTKFELDQYGVIPDQRLARVMEEVSDEGEPILVFVRFEPKE